MVLIFLKLILYINKMLYIIMVEFEEIINTRRSIREYQDKDVEDEKILKAINLGVINRIAGAVFAVVQGLLILSLLLNLWIAIFPDTELLKESSGAVEQRLINLAPDLLGSDTAQEFLNATKELAK